MVGCTGGKQVAFILDASELRDPIEVSRRLRAYQEYLHSLRGRLAVGAYEYATSDWHTDYSNRMSPHDAWVQSLIIEEPASGERGENRSLKITIELLGSFHDGRIRFTYAEVRAYALSVPAGFEGPPLTGAHGDWKADEVRLSEHELVLHEIVFSRGAHWQIEALDMKYEWLPF
jgi:hypothetical protein